MKVGTTYRPLDSVFRQVVLPRVDIVEVTPEAVAEWGAQGAAIPSAILEELAEIARHVTVVAHGVGLSIGTYSGWDETALVLLEQLMARVPIAWFSEHLGFVNVGGSFLGTMLSLPRTGEARDMVAARVEELHDRFRLPVLLENVVNLLPDPPGEMTEAEFLNSIAAGAGCGILLDLHNLDCDARNGRLCADAFLHELNFDHVREIHVAGGTEHRGYRLDIHSRAVPTSTFALLQRVRPRLAQLEAAVYEVMSEAAPVLGHERWSQEIDQLRWMMEDVACASMPINSG